MNKKTKVGYVDGFVFTVSKKNVGTYKKMAKEGKEAWMKFGALDYYECMGQDLKIKTMEGMPKQRSFIEVTNAKNGDTVWFSYITFKSKAHRDQVNKKVMAYFNKKYANVDPKDMSMPFDVSNMAYGGFKVEIGS